MLAVNHAARRTNIEGWIAASPWTCTVYRRGRTGDDTDSTFSVSGRISPAGARGIPLNLGGKMEGEDRTVRYASVLVTAWDATQIKSDDRINAIHDETSIETDYVVKFVRRTPHKYEIILDEVQ